MRIGRTIYGHKRKGDTRHGDTDLTLPPSRTTLKWGGGVGALEASRDMEPGQVASRAMAFPGPTAEKGARATMAE